MRTLTPQFASHIRQPVTTLAVCWRVAKNNGELILGTQHDRDISISVSQHTVIDLAGVYRAQAAITGSDVRSASDMSVDNMEVDGSTTPSTDSGDINIDISVQDIEAGLLDNAQVCVFLVNWAAPDAGQAILRRGLLGELSRDSDGRYRTEVRGLSQLLSQQLGFVYQDTCNVVRFGDSRCRYDVDAIRIESPVTAVISNRRFSIAEPTAPPPAGYPLGGEVLFESGENTGYRREVKATTVSGGELTVELYEETPADIEVGALIQLTPGCDRRWSTCRQYGNLVNFRGWGVYIPGTMALMRGNAPGECEVPLPDIEPPVPGTPPEPGSGDVLFLDGFNYAVARSAPPSEMQAAFQAAGWAAADAENGTGYDSGYLYTATSIAGFAGSLPAGVRMLAMEGYPNRGSDPTFLQTDYWLQYGSEGAPSPGAIPANFWWQCWIYLQNFGTQLSSYPNRNKFLYPVVDHYPGNVNPSEGPIGCPWLVLLGAQGYEASMGPRADNYVGIQAFGADRGDGDDRLFQNVNSKRIVANQWHLLKIHIDVSTANGTAEAWLRAQGESDFTKIIDYRPGITAGYSWPTYPETRNGFRMLRMPTTENADPLSNPLRNGYGTNIKFLQAFCMANSEAALPRY